MKARQLYERALALINERASGGAYHSDISDFESNAPELINMLISILLYDESVIKGVRLREIDRDRMFIESLDSELPLDDAITSGVMPFGLASFLILEEDRERAEYFHRLYAEARRGIISAYADAKHRSVKNVY